MPLDATGARNIVSLADVLTEIGVTPVPMKDLEAHKVDQVRRHPPSLFNTPKPYVALGVGTFALTLGLRLENGVPLTLSGVTAACFSALAVAGLFLFCIALVLGSLGLKLKGRANWVERYSYRRSNDDPMPEAVREVKQYIANRLPDARFFYGELVQRAEVLDPYLVAEICGDTLSPWAGQRACLGIWDDSGIIRIAAIDPTE